MLETTTTYAIIIETFVRYPCDMLSVTSNRHIREIQLIYFGMKWLISLSVYDTVIRKCANILCPAILYCRGTTILHDYWSCKMPPGSPFIQYMQFTLYGNNGFELSWFRSGNLNGQTALCPISRINECIVPGWASGPQYDISITTHLTIYAAR